MAVILVVQSKVKEYVKSKGLATSAEAVGALSQAVQGIIDRAASRARANGRKTVKAQDI